jgi:ABC-2 type transport system permease protein
MAVYKRTYTRYTGELTDERWRFWILSRYALKTVFDNKLTMGLFLLGLLPHLVAIVLIYLRSHLDALLSLNLEPLEGLRFLNIDGSFFSTIFIVETFLSFFLIALVGPGLVAPDLGNNAMPLYLSRPFSRTEYVLGKLTVLVGMTSLITWVPGLITIGAQTLFVGFSWLSDNLRIAVGIFIGSWIWILTVSVIALAISAWVKWKPVAIAGLFAVFFVTAGFGTAANVLLEMRLGTYLNIVILMRMLWRWFFLGDEIYRLNTPPFGSLPSWTALVALAGICSLALLLLSRRIRPTQVVR